MTHFHIYDLVVPSSLVSIVDVGAAINIRAQNWHQDLLDNNVARLTGFEPNQEACDELNARHDGTVHKCFPYFIGDGSEATFHIMNEPQCSSLYAPNLELISMFTGLDRTFQQVGTEEVTTTRLDDVEDLSCVLRSGICRAIPEPTSIW